MASQATATPHRARARCDRRRGCPLRAVAVRPAGLSERRWFRTDCFVVFIKGNFDWLPRVLSGFGVYLSKRVLSRPNGQRERRDPAATVAPTVNELNGWLPSA